MDSKIIDDIAVGVLRESVLIESGVFVGCEFNNFSINPVDGFEVKFKDCRFDRCSLSRGAFQLGRNVSLDGVNFNDFDVGGELSIHSGVKISRTKISCSKVKSMLWIKNVMGDPGCENNVIELDISEFCGGVIITGNDVSMVTINPEKQIFVYSKLLDQDRFKINRTNFFRSSASKVKIGGTQVGVFSIPNKDAVSDDFWEQLEYFESKGFVSRKYSQAG